MDEASLPFISESGVNPVLSEEPILATLKVSMLQDNAEVYPQDPIPPPLFASRPLTRFKSPQVHNMKFKYHP